jgi:hypothetical protein
MIKLVFDIYNHQKTSISLAMVQVAAKEREKITFPCQMQRGWSRGVSFHFGSLNPSKAA